MKFQNSSTPSDRSPESTTIDLVLAQDGDPDAFRRVVVATEADVRRFCAWLCQPGSDLDDLVQETYLRAFRGVGSFRSESTGLAWLLTIARRVCTDHVKRKVKDRRNLAVAPVAPDQTPCSSGFVDAMADVVNLAPVYREAFVLVAVLGFTYDEAASIMGCPRGTVQSRVARARLELIAVSTETDGAQRASAR